MPCQFQIVNAPLQIVPSGAEIAQLLCYHDLIVFGRCFYFGVFRWDDSAIQFLQLFFAGCDVKRQFIIELQRLFIEQVERFDVL